ncbi:glycosyltransferase [Clostridium sporogenes]|uniref:glycosyltransferase n=1 Tax=Clostridium sporogenes TaxID=1509 RepID=UPI0013D4C67A|nr:glycosyltransferase [Clostridium sporogenes]NFP91583.1 glycosyltransferase family 4 protein [Clostridium sporogenes]
MNDFIIITNGYPSEKKLYNNAFIHRRVINYLEKGYKGFVIVIRPENKTLKKYKFDNVVVYEGNSANVKELLLENLNVKIFIHFVDIHMIRAIRSVSEKYDIFIWIHGAEALAWKRRLFNLRFNLKSILSFIKYIYFNVKQMKLMRNLILNDKLNIKFIFVSNWMKDILERDTNTVLDKSKYEIIPNIIDDKLFYYHEKTEKQCLKVLSIRPYTSRKYANDISVEIVLKLSEKDYFNDITFNFYGNGYLFEKTLKPLTKFKNVNIYKKFLNQFEIAKLHSENGVFLSPTRQDAQGVSMCEAIASGLVPIVSNNTAIPEFVNLDFGFLCNNINDFVKAFDTLYNNPSDFICRSKKGAEFMLDKCGSHIIDKELESVGFKSLDTKTHNKLQI